MFETVNQWLAFLGWTSANVISLGYGAALSTVAAWTTKYPLRLYAERNGYPLPAFKWAVRTIAGAGALVGTELTWPARGRGAWLAGVLAWALVLLLYRYSKPLLSRFAPWISTDHLVNDDGDEAGA